MSKPHSVDPDALREWLQDIEWVSAVGDARVWVTGAGPAAWVTLLKRGRGRPEDLEQLSAKLWSVFGLAHVTLYVEPESVERTLDLPHGRS